MKGEILMNNKEELKVDSFVFYDNPYDAVNRVAHGSEYYYKGYCLIEYNNELYLANAVREQIDTDEGSAYYMSGMGKHDSVGDITDEIGIPWINEARTSIDYTYIEDLKKINEDGELSENVDDKLKEKIKEYKSISVSTNDENYMKQEDEYISINPRLKEIINEQLSVDMGYDTVIVSKDDIPYGKINETLELEDNKLILHMNEKEYVLDELQETKNDENSLNNTVLNEEQKQELLKILAEQQEKIAEQENELSELEDKRRSLDEQ